EYCYGQKLLRQNHPVLLEFLLREQRKAEEILERLKDSETASARTRRLEMEEEAKIRKEALAYYEM
ncbi:MAG: SAM-dependent methyltransferase, partial [Blautia producta]